MNTEQKEAQEALEAAVRQHVAAFRPPNDEGPSEIVSDWALVANVISWDKDGDKLSAYHMGYAGGQMEEHRAVGLFAVATDHVMDAGE